MHDSSLACASRREYRLESQYHTRRCPEIELGSCDRFQREHRIHQNMHRRLQKWIRTSRRNCSRHMDSPLPTRVLDVRNGNVRFTIQVELLGRTARFLADGTAGVRLQDHHEQYGRHEIISALARISTIDQRCHKSQETIGRAVLVSGRLVYHLR